MALQTDPRTLDGRALRADFPVFERPTASGRPLAYLDSASSSQKPRAVIEALADAYAHHYANVHRGIYELSVDADERYEAARAAVARFIGAPSPREIVFVRNATEALNLVAHSYGRSVVGAGDLVVSTEMEHHANLIPWQQLAAATGATLAHVHLTDDGRLDLDELARHLERRPRIVAVGHVSNALGTINPVAEIARMAHDAGATVVLDAAQSVPHMPVDVTALGVDFAALSGHKMLGPSGIGALWGRRELLDAMPPFLTGGSMIKRVTLEACRVGRGPVEVRGRHAGHRRDRRPGRGRRVSRGARNGHGAGARARAVRGHLVGPRSDPGRAAARTRGPGPARRRRQLRGRRHPSPRRRHRPRSARASRCEPATTAPSR